MNAAELTITLTRNEAQCLYDHTGTMPYAPGSWSHNVRARLSEALAGGVPREDTQDREGQSERVTPGGFESRYVSSPVAPPGVSPPQDSE